MDGWTGLVLAGLLLAFGVRAAADVLELRALGGALPAPLRAVYDADRHRRAQQYAAARLRFGIVVAAARLAVLLACWLGGGFGLVDRWSGGLGVGPVSTGLAFLGALGLGDALLALPPRWYATFVLEERFGFNRTTPRVFWGDAVKGLLLGVLLGGPLLAVVLWLFAAQGGAAWLWCWAAAAAWSVGVQYVAPTWILPLFNRFTPLPEGPLHDAIVGYTRRLDFPLAGVSVIDGSRRSTKANAFFTGFGARKRIAVFDTLVERHAPEEVLGVVAHEVGHYRLRHVPMVLALAIAQLGATFFLLSLVLRAGGLFAAFGLERSVHAGLVVFAIVATPAGLPLAVVLNALSRRHERQADRFAAETTGEGRALARALARLAADTLANPTPHPLYVALHYSHPPVVERLRALAPVSPA